jgi:hypothetical protein
MDSGKRGAAAPPGAVPAAKRGPVSDFDDLIEDELAGDDVAPAYLPDDLDEPDPELGEAGRNWQRPAPAQLDPAQDSLSAFAVAVA